jgi:hypothetical protein
MGPDKGTPFDEAGFWLSQVHHDAHQKARHWNELMTLGVTVVPILAAEVRPRILAEVLEAVRHSPELKAPIGAGEPIMVTLGGFGALGTASSFHFPIVRKLRGEILTKLVGEVFRYAPEGYALDPLPDRLCLRMKNQEPTPESGHRDISPHTHASDLVTGGWLNLSSKPQSFSCQKETQYEPLKNAAGFAKFTLDRKKAGPVPCPPGCFILFNQHIAHEVNPIKAEGENADPYAKLFLGFRLTRTGYGLMDRLLQDAEHRKYASEKGAKAAKHGFPAPKVYQTAAEVYLDQGLPLLPSGQKIPQYSSQHYGFKELYMGKHYPKDQNIPGGLKTWSSRFVEGVPRVNVDWVRDKDDRVPRFFPSLGYLGKKLEEYAEGELLLAAGGPRQFWPAVWTLNAAGAWEERDVHLKGARGVHLKGGGASPHRMRHRRTRHRRTRHRRTRHRRTRHRRKRPFSAHRRSRTLSRRR